MFVARQHCFVLVPGHACGGAPCRPSRVGRGITLESAVCGDCELQVIRGGRVAWHGGITTHASGDLMLRIVRVHVSAGPRAHIGCRDDRGPAYH